MPAPLLDSDSHSYFDDPSLVGLSDVLSRYVQFSVLRYRPGKRITIAATDEQLGDVIIKFAANGIRGIFDRLCAVSAVRHELSFNVSKPIECAVDANYVVQERLSGRPISIASKTFDEPLVRAMAGAIKSLHESTAAFGTKFDARSQTLRTQRYLQLIASRIPDTRNDINTMQCKLRRLEQHVRRRDAHFVPIHGSPHSHQWLYDDGQLALVDFDRAAMGDPELDIATFLAEFDYESPEIGPAVNRAFLAQFDDHDRQTLTFYRTHKHLAKAFKASKHTQREIAFKKTRRNLARAARLLSDVQE